MGNDKEYPIYKIENTENTVKGPKVLVECVICLENDPPPFYTVIEFRYS
jgi:hypothetical protein